MINPEQVYQSSKYIFLNKYHNKYDILLYHDSQDKHLIDMYSNIKNKADDSGLDLFFPDDIVIPANSTVLVSLDIIVKVVDTYNVSFSPFTIMPRSSIYKTPIRLANSIGLIDRGYFGPLKVPLDNIHNTDYKISKGDRLFQIVLPQLSSQFNILVKETPFVIDSDRGQGGFGSTGPN
jgi:dUTP pyrophosphatase